MHNLAEVVVVLEQCQMPGQLLAEVQPNLFNQINMHEITEIPADIVQLETDHYTGEVVAEVVPELPANQLKDTLPAVKVATEWLATLAEH